MQPTIQYSIYINILKPTVQLQIYSTQPTIQNIHEYSQTYTVQLQIQYTVYTAKHTVYTWIFSSLQFSYKYTVHCTVHSQPYRIYMNILKPTVQQLQIYCTVHSQPYRIYMNNLKPTVQLQIYCTLYKCTVHSQPYSIYIIIRVQWFSTFFNFTIWPPFMNEIYLFWDHKKKKNCARITEGTRAPFSKRAERLGA